MSQSDTQKIFQSNTHTHTHSGLLQCAALKPNQVAHIQPITTALLNWFISSGVETSHNQPYNCEAGLELLKRKTTAVKKRLHRPQEEEAVK